MVKKKKQLGGARGREGKGKEEKGLVDGVAAVEVQTRRRGGGGRER
jgi:hypothetical protein